VAFKGTGKQEDADYLMQEYIAGGMLINQASESSSTDDAALHGTKCC